MVTWCTGPVDDSTLSIAIDLMLHDSLYGAAIATQLGVTGMAGTVSSSSGKKLATFSTSPVGSGSIRYSDRTTGTISLFLVNS